MLFGVHQRYVRMDVMPDIMQQVPTNVPFVRPIHIRNLIISVIIRDTAADHDSIDDCIPMEIEEISCNPGYYLPANSQQCTQCPRNFYCPGGQYTEASSDSGITQCPDGLYSPPGSDSADDCGRILHIGEYVLYLRTAKLTSPALHVKIGDVIYYGDMFPA